MRPSVQRVLDALTVPAWIRNGRADVVATNTLGRALYAPLYDDPVRPANTARFTFLSPQAKDFYRDWDRTARDMVAVLRAAAGTDPWRERDRFAAGSPVEITELGEAFATAGGDLDQAHALSGQSQQLLASGFTNDTTPVYDQTTHIARLPRNFGDAGTRLADIGRRCGRTATELADRTRQANSTVTELVTGLDRERDRWAAQVIAANHIPIEAVPGFRARRDQIAARMQEVVNRAGAALGSSTREYEATLASLLRLLADVGYLPPDELDVGPTAPEPGRTPSGVDTSSIEPPIERPRGYIPIDTAPPRREIFPRQPPIVSGGPGVGVLPFPAVGGYEGGTGSGQPPGSSPDVHDTLPTPPADRHPQLHYAATIHHGRRSAPRHPRRRHPEEEGIRYGIRHRWPELGGKDRPGHQTRPGPARLGTCRLPRLSIGEAARAYRRWSACVEQGRNVEARWSTAHQY